MTHQGTPEGPDPLAGVLADPDEPLVVAPPARRDPVDAPRKEDAAP